MSKSPFGHTIFEIVPDYGEPLIKKKVELKELKRIKNTFEKFLQKPEEKSQEDFEDNLNSKEEPKIKTFNKEVKDEFPKFYSRIP